MPSQSSPGIMLSSMVHTYSSFFLKFSSHLNLFLGPCTAMKAGQVATSVKFLRSKGAAMELKNNAGKTARDLAIDMGVALD